jgi:hypothetical protein
VPHHNTGHRPHRVGKVEPASAAATGRGERYVSAGTVITSGSVSRSSAHSCRVGRRDPTGPCGTQGSSNPRSLRCVRDLEAGGEPRPMPGGRHLLATYGSSNSETCRANGIASGSQSSSTAVISPGQQRSFVDSSRISEGWSRATPQ